VVDNIAPVVEVIPADRRGGRMVRVQCPWCSRTHLHGWPAGQPAPGWRVPHCGHGGNYRIPAPVVPAIRRIRVGGTR
jgi:hypothetical protein